MDCTHEEAKDREECGTVGSRHGGISLVEYRFACTTPKVYATLALVNQEWKTMLEKLEPPGLFGMRALLQKTQDGKFNLRQEHLRVLDEWLKQLVSKFNHHPEVTRLFREASNDEENNTIRYSTLQPQFALVLMKFVYAQRSDLSQHVCHKLVCCYRANNGGFH